MNRTRLVRGVMMAAYVAATVASLSSQAPPSTPGNAYTPPRTPWGDPDLPGKWPGTEMVGVPMQRPEKLGTAKRAHRRRVRGARGQVAQQEEQDNADFDLETAAEHTGPATSAARVAAAALARARRAAAPGVADRRSAERPHAGVDAGRRRSVRARGGALSGSRGPADPNDSQPLRPLHHARHRRLDAAGDLQQRQRDRAVAGLRGDPQRDDPRDAHRPARRPRRICRPSIKSYMGDSRGHWEGDTLVVETTNFTAAPASAQRRRRRHSDALKLIERFTRVRADTLQYEMTVDDPQDLDAAVDDARSR